MRDMQDVSFLQEYTDISHLSGYKTRVRARYFFELCRREDLELVHRAYRFAKEQHLRFLILGGGTNLLFALDIFDGVIIKNNLQGWNYDTQTGKLTAASNESLWYIGESLEKEYGQPLWHRFIGLPGSVGGAIYGNAGCFGLETESNLESVDIYDLSLGQEKILSKEEMQFSYRHSLCKIKPEYFILGGRFDLSKKVEKYASTVDNIYFREHKQPKGNTCGSFFKNPSREISAGYLIESVGLKGYHHGGAYWSHIHANFLMSDGAACRWQDLIELIELTEKKVLEETGYKLEREVQIITL